MKKRIVVKVGTSTLSHDGGGLNFKNIEKIVRTLADIRNAGNEVILVTSGAIAAGAGKLRFQERPKELRFKQAASAVGQCELMHIYDKYFGEYGTVVGQILLTREDVDRPHVCESLTATFNALLELGVIPVINENDSVCFEEIESEHRVFGDNDTLSAVVAALVHADLLILLSDIDGLYDSDPHRNPDASLIPVADPFDEKIVALAGGAGSRFGTGGMQTKLAAARIANKAGVDMVITNGAAPQNIYNIVEGRIVGTLFTGGKNDD